MHQALLSKYSCASVF